MPPSPPDTPRSDTAGWLALGAVVALGAVARLAALDQVEVVTDTIHPFTRAVGILRLERLPWQGVGSNFHYGVLQPWLAVPLVAVSRGLGQVLAWNALVHALGALLAGLGARRLVRNGPTSHAGEAWTAALVAAALTTTWPALLDHALRPAFTYLAPVLVAAGAWAILGVRSGAPENHRRLLLGAGLLAAAVHQHPYALAVILGALALVPWLRRTCRSALLPAAAVAAGILAPMAADNAWVLWTRATTGMGTSMTQDLAMAGESTLALLARAWREGAVAWPWPVAWGALLLPLCALPAVARDRFRGEGARLLAWYALSLAGLGGVALALGYLQPYHVAVVLPLHVLVAGWGVARLGGAVLARHPRLARATAAGIVGATGVLLVYEVSCMVPTDPPDQTRLGLVAEGVAAIRTDAGDRPRTLALLSDVSRNPVGDPTAWFLEQWLAGDPDTLFPATIRSDRRMPRAYVVADLSDTTWAAWGNPTPGREPGRQGPAVLLQRSTGPDTSARILAFSEPWSAHAWLERTCEPLPDPGAVLRVFGPKEGLGGVAGLVDDPDPILWEWAEPCPEVAR